MGILKSFHLLRGLTSLSLVVKTLFLLGVIHGGMCPSTSQAVEKPESILQEAGVTERRGEAIDLNLTFTDDQGTQRTLRELFSTGKPVILLPVYYHCPRLCGLLLKGVVTVLNKLALDLGPDYSVVSVSFDTSEGPEDAAKRAVEFRQQYRDSESAKKNWSFLVGTESQVGALMQGIGFNYLPDKGEFAHAAAMVLLTSEGKISQYLTGITFSPWDTKLALVEASQGKIGSVIDHVLLFCFRFDPTKGKYTWAAFTAMRVGTILMLGSLILAVVYYARRA